ncbi:DUF6083 domain-containing protein [Streptomyces sp. 8N706]|uniref:DUF6083 domain-containing protein n=1 Tax=Streptomyces sp. 8N706 TaxID=3457416 RepID=UPI003FD1B3E7
MRSTNNPWAEEIRWDGSLKRRPTRALRIAPTSPSRLLRADQRRPCTHCGNPVDWYYRNDDRPVSLHPSECDAGSVPEPYRWHVQSGIAHPHHDGSPWCRIPHLALCPARPADNRSLLLGELRRDLAAATRRLIDTGAFTPRREPPQAPPADLAPGRPVVQLLHTRYLAPGPLETIQCVAQTRTRSRCPHPLHHQQPTPGEWSLTPVHSTTHTQPPLFPDDVMAVYGLDHLPYAEQLRWRAQRCTAHAATPGAADIALTEWEPFNPATHTRHIHPRLPDTSPSPRRT